MSLRRFLPLLALALVIAPFGRMAAAEAKPAPHHQARPSGSYCAGQPQPMNDADHDRVSIDCMIACAAMAAGTDAFVIPPMAALGPPVPVAVAHRAGIRPEAEPPPPRFV